MFNLTLGLQGGLPGLGFGNPPTILQLHGMLSDIIGSHPVMGCMKGNELSEFVHENIHGLRDWSDVETRGANLLAEFEVFAASQREGRDMEEWPSPEVLCFAFVRNYSGFRHHCTWHCDRSHEELNAALHADEHYEYQWED